uniref:U12-Hexatoxin-Hc1a_1 n=1 Tax=Hadronyche cerberea TaxID=1107879 RepID=A0A4Q8K9M1_HADCE
MKCTPLLFCIGLILFAELVRAVPYIPEDELLAEYNDRLENILGYEKRSCLRRGSSCDHRPHDCCYSSACRCNLWGTNCRCQRAGLFQRWGRK